MPGDAALADLAQRLTQIIDPVNGGVKGAPKFPQPQLLNYLWRGGLRYGLDLPQTAVALTLNHIAQGGIYDHLGGGFARYASTTAGSCRISRRCSTTTHCSSS